MGQKTIKAFSLVEILVSLTVFAIFMIIVQSALYGVYKDWQRQRDNLQCIKDAQRAMEFMANEIRKARNTETALLPGLSTPGFAIKIGIPSGDDICYWRGDDDQYGNQTFLYRATKPNINNLDQVKDIKQQFASFIVDNPSTSPIFEINNGLVNITLTVRPDPARPEGTGNLNYSLTTSVRPRN
jgi:type II secretory pathway pseudopilin PulG